MLYFLYIFVIFAPTRFHEISHCISQFYHSVTIVIAEDFVSERKTT